METFVYGLRSVCRVPMNVGNSYRAYYLKHPRTVNFFSIYFLAMGVLLITRGAEKFTFRGATDVYELKRRARRFFVPYWMTSYRWRFPVNERRAAK